MTTNTFQPSRKLIAGARSYALALTRNEADADDLVQDSLVRAHRFWRSFDESKATLPVWLHAIVHNTFINTSRANDRRRVFHGKIEGFAYCADTPSALTRMRPCFDEEIARKHAHTRVREVVKALPKQYRMMIRLVDLEGASYKEAADLVGCPIGTVMSRVYRGRHSMAEKLSDVADVAAIL